MKVWDVFNSKFSDNSCDENREYIGDGDERMEIYFYERDWVKTVSTYILIALTAGLLGLLFYWKPHWFLYFTNRRCKPIDAQFVLLIDKYNQFFVERIVSLRDESKGKFVIPKFNGVFESTEYLRYFENKKIKYLWNQKDLSFEKLFGLDRNILCSAFSQQKGLLDEEQIQRSHLFGINTIEIKVQSFLYIMFHEVFSPFYVFQIGAIILWGLEDYYYYGGYILVMSTTSVLISCIQTHKNQRKLRKTVSGEDIVDVCKCGDNYRTQETRHLVPGDVIVLPSNDFEMHCDVVLLNGNAIVDESMLTGETVPVMKTAIPYSEVEFNRRYNFKHIIFAGTKVIQTRFYGEERVKAVVIRTGFQTAKGELVRTILFPKPIDFKFNRHIIHFIFIMLFIAIGGLVYTFIIKSERDDNIGSIFIKALDLITIVVPPELPAAMTVASVFVDSRLRKNDVYCMSPRSITMAGCVDCVCFDKTGTLTEDELSLAEVLPTDMESRQFKDPVVNVDELELSPLLLSLASCHSLTILNNKIIGDPLDIKMFESTKWVLEEPEVNDINKFDLLAPTIVKPPYVQTETGKPQLGILRQFDFSSNLSRMSVITRLLDAKGFELYVKGAPEVIATLCNGDTVPKDFDSKLLSYTEKSYRVLALAYRPLLQMSYTKVQRAQREDLERDLIFLGLVVMKNNLKDRTVETMNDLHNANIRTLMATGDNLMTAISVAQECHLIDKNESIIIIESHFDCQGIPYLQCLYKETKSNSKVMTKDMKCLQISVERKSHLALTGKTFNDIEKYFPNLLPKLIACGTVFARMSPENKQQLIELLQGMGYIVSMTGDGANDVGALKASNCGISLSDTEASVAAPFTSKTPNISCVTILLRESRCSLVSVFGVIKYMACYNITSFMAVIILYSCRSNLTDIENLYQDLLLISVFVLLFGRTGAHTTLSAQAPPTSLMSVTQILSIVTQLVLVCAFQMIAFILVREQSWYKPHEPKDELDYKSHDNYAVFGIQVFQYISLAVVYSKGEPFRKPFYTNILFSIALILTITLTLYIVVAPEVPNDWTSNLFEIQTKGFSYEFRGILIALSVCHFVLAIILEKIFIEKVMTKMFCLTKEKKFNKIRKECSDGDWIQH